MTLLSMIKDVADVVGVPRPTVVINSTDTQVRQLLSLANIEGRSLRKRHDWTVLLKEATHTTTAAEDQGLLTAIAADIDTLAPIVNETIYNRTDQMRVRNTTPQRWQLEKASSVSGPYSRYRIRGGNLLLIPAPAAGETIAFEYPSVNWCEKSDGTDQSAWAADTDVGLLDEDLMALGIRWRFLRAKGLDYSEEFAEYEREVLDYAASDGSKETLSLDSPQESRGIVVPEGSWSL